MSELRTNRIIPRDGLPSGSAGGIIQVKSATKTDTYSKPSGTSFLDVPGLSVSITPTRSDSKILVMYDLCWGIADGHGSMRLMRDSTPIKIGDSAGNRYLVNSGFSSNNNEDQSMMSCSNSFLDSPATTSATTYQMCMLCGGTTLDIFINRARSDGNETDDPRAASSLILMEVSA